MSEQPTSPEKREITDLEVIDAIRKIGTDSAEEELAQKILVDWTIQEEAKVGPTSTDQIEFNIRRAKIYNSAGKVTEALEVLEDAREQAWNEWLNDLHLRIGIEIQKMQNKPTP